MDCENNLVIVGNGFDVSNGLPSRYSDFKEWLNRNDNELFLFLEKYIDVSGDWWNDFERNLSEINVPKLIRETPLDNHPRDPRLLPDFSHPASWRLDKIHDILFERFTDWIQSVEGKPAKKEVNLPDAGLYISFNYTDTLERIYGIDTEKILYIHGKASRGDKLIFGHGKSHLFLEDDVMQRYRLRRSEDFFTPGTISDSEYELIQHIAYLEKRPYDQLIRYGELLLSSVMSAHCASVYGLSFSEVDRPYVEWIVEKNPSIRWRVSWHTEKDNKCISDTLRTLGATYELFYM